MRAKIIETETGYEVINCIRETSYKIIRVLEMDSKIFEFLLNCDKEKRLLFINKLIEGIN